MYVCTVCMYVHTPGYICDWSLCTILKMFDISFRKPPSRNSMFIHLVYNKDKIISFLYMFILHEYYTKR